MTYRHVPVKFPSDLHDVVDVSEGIYSLLKCQEAQRFNAEFNLY